MNSIPCGWPLDICDEPEFVDIDPSILQEAQDEAAYILWSYTGQRFGLCEVNVTPPPKCTCDWVNWCTHKSCTLYIPGPVHEVLDVIINGESVHDWVLADNKLIREVYWPRDVSVTYLQGLPIPPGAHRAVRTLSTELALSYCKSSKCKLPSNITQRTRQGDTINLAPLSSGLTGIVTVDRWIDSVNNTTNRSRVWSPDIDPWVFTPPTSPGSV